MNIVFKDWKDLPRFSYANKNPLEGRWSYRNGGFNDRDTGTWYIVNIKPVLTCQRKYDYTFYVYQLPPEICYVINSMIAESHNDVLYMVTGGLPKRMNDDGMGYVKNS